MGAIWGGYALGNGGGCTAILPQRSLSRVYPPPQWVTLGVGSHGTQRGTLVGSPWLWLLAHGPMDLSPGASPQGTRARGGHRERGQGIDKLSIPGAQAPWPPLT